MRWRRFRRGSWPWASPSVDHLVAGMTPKMAWEVANVLEVVAPRQSHGATRRVLVEAIHVCRRAGAAYEAERSDA